MYTIRSTVNKGSFTSSGLKVFISFFFLTLLISISKVILNRTDENGHSCLILYPRGKAVKTLNIKSDYSCNFLTDAFCCIKGIMNCCCISSNVFPHLFVPPTLGLELG